MGNIRIATAYRNAMVAVLRAALDAGSGPGSVLIYGDSQPAGPGTAITAQELLAELALDDPSGSECDGTLTFAPITEASSACATGTPTWCRFVDSDGNAIFDADAGTPGSGAFLEITAETVDARGSVRITAGTITLPSSIMV